MNTATLAAPVAVTSIAPLSLSAPGRRVDLRLRVTAPTTGTDLPVVLFSHGLGHSHHLSSLEGYAPLVQRWAAAGLVVVQPTHLDSRTLGLSGAELAALPHWRSRVEDLRLLLDRLDEVENLVPGLAGRLNRDRVAVAGHSMGGNTAALMLGMRVAVDDAVVDLREPRVAAGVLLAAPGSGGEAVTETVRANYPFLAAVDFAAMTAPALVVAGDADASAHLTVRGPAWHAEPYHLSPGPKALLTLYGGEHGLGGVSGFDVAETTDEDPRRAAAVAEATGAYLLSELTGDDSGWRAAAERIAAESLGSVVAKSA